MTSPNISLGMVAPEEWRRRTAIRLARRSPKLLAIDTAYEEYYGSRVEANASKLFFLLEGYLRDHEGRWSRVDRNVASNGLMEAVYRLSRAHAGIPDPSLAPTHPRHILEAQAANARLGVLYLFSNMEVSTQHAAVFLEGGFDVLAGGAELIPEAGAFTVRGVDLHGTQGIAPGAELGKAVAGYERGHGTSHGVERQPVVTFHGRRGAIVQGMHNAPVVPPPPPPPRIAVPQNRAVTALMDAGAAMYDGGAYVLRLGHDLVQYLWQKIKEFAEWTIAKIRQNERTAWSVSGSAIVALVKAAVAYVAKNVAPVVGGLIDIGRGVMEIISAAKSRIEAALLRRRFDIQAGHPQALAGAIESAMNWAIGSGVWTTLKGCAKTGLMFVSAGASHIGEAVAAALEFVTKTILRIRESTKLSAVGVEAKSLYAECHVASTNPENTSVQPKPGSLITKTAEFTQKYEEWCDASPCVPMLTLNSGICGDLMQLMKMFDDTSSASVVTQEAFNAGAEYFTSLKQFGRKYLRDSGFTFTSGNTTVRGLLHHAVSHHTEGALGAGEALLTVLGG